MSLCILFVLWIFLGICEYETGHLVRDNYSARKPKYDQRQPELTEIGHQVVVK